MFNVRCFKVLQTSWGDYITIEVLVQIYGPFEGSGAGYRWVTIGIIEDPKHFDLESLKKKAADIVEGNSYKSPADMIRLVFRSGGKQYMKTIFY